MQELRRGTADGRQSIRLCIHLKQISGSYALVWDLESLQLKKKDEPEFEGPTQTGFRSPKSPIGLRRPVITSGPILDTQKEKERCTF